MENSFQGFGWKENPFTLKIDPSLFIGYEDQVSAAKRHVSEKHKISLVTGATGSGKTTLLKWLESDLTDAQKIYLSKPPQNSEEFINIFTNTFGISFWDRFLGNKPNLYNLHSYINKRLKGKHLVMMVDESHETNKDVLEWIRVLTDQIESVSLILAGMPQLETKIKTDLETLNQRITSRILLNSLTESETRELIKRRITAAGGEDIKPFTDSAIESIYQKTGGFPREILKMCDRLISRATEEGSTVIEAKMVDDFREFISEPTQTFDDPVTFSPRPPSENKIKTLPYKQRKILEALSKQDWMTPSDISDNMNIESYGSRDNAVRSINNILRRLKMDGFVQRESRGKSFMYALTPRVKTLFVEQ